MLKIAKVVSLNSDAEAAQVLISQDRGEYELFCLLKTSVEDAFSRSRVALLELEEFFYGAEESIGSKLTQGLQILNQSLINAATVEVLLVAIQAQAGQQKLLYLLTNATSLKGYLLRGEEKIILTDLGADSQLVSGFFQSGDRLVLTTQSLQQILGSDETAVLSLPLETVEDEVNSRLPEAEVLPVALVVAEEERVEGVGSSVKLEPREGGARTKALISSFGRMGIRLIPRSRRGLAILGVILLLVVGVGVWVSLNRQKNAQIEAQFSAHYQKAEAEFAKANSLKDLDPASSLVSLQTAQAEVGEALKLKPDDSGALRLQSTINSERGGILKVQTVEEIPVWLDLSLIKKDFRAKQLSLSLDKLLVLDGQQASLVQINLQGKAHKILAGEDDFGEGIIAALNGERAFVYSTDKGVVRVDSQNQQTTTVNKSDPEWGEIIDLFGFGSNVYLLDRRDPSTGSGQVWKFVPVESGYSGKQRYLKPETTVDFSTAIRLQIDSSVWVLKQNGEIEKFTQGVRDNFSYLGLDRPVSNPKSFFVSDATENLYLLDSGNQRIVVLTKTGGYQGQYRSELITQMLDLVVDEEGQKIYLLDGAKIYIMSM